jgi:RNA polymerase sigma factor (sigma-70 family)
MHTVIQQLRRGALANDATAVTDGELLAAFLTVRDEAAFEGLVRRHGPMVLGVCRRLLQNPHDAEDAFQATFVVLVRKGASIVPRETVGNWLYGVAYRTALGAKRANARRREKEKNAQLRQAATPEATWEELQPLLDQELSRLPNKYRLPIVLCDLEGKKRREVARQLNLPDGTLNNRLAMARQLLAKRLARRGFTLSGGALAVSLSQGLAVAALPTGLLGSTVKAATTIAAGGATTSVLPAKVAALTEGMVKAMLVTKFKFMTALILALTALGVGAAFVTCQALVPAMAGADQPAQTSKPGKDKQHNKPTKSDKDKLQGTWIAVSVQFGGKPAPEAFVKSFKLVFTGDKVTVHPSDDGAEGGKEGDFTLDSKKTPKEINFDGEGKTTKGIYTFEKEALKLAMAEIGQDRPTEFKSLDGTRHGLIVFKRADKPDKNQQDEKDENVEVGTKAGPSKQIDILKVHQEAKEEHEDASKTKPVARAVALQFVFAFLTESDSAKVLEFFDPDADRKGRGKGTAVEVVKRELELPRRLRESAKLREIVFFSTKEDVAKLAERYPGETMWGRLPTQIDQLRDGVGCLVVVEGPNEGTTGLGAYLFKKVGDNYRIVYMDDN